MRATISLHSGGIVLVQARGKTPSGIIGDMTLQIAPGETVAGVPYEVWRNYAGKTVELDDVRREADAATAHG